MPFSLSLEPEVLTLYSILISSSDMGRAEKESGDSTVSCLFHCLFGATVPGPFWDEVKQMSQEQPATPQQHLWPGLDNFTPKMPSVKRNSCYSKCHGHHGGERPLGSPLILPYSWGLTACLMPGCLRSFSWGLGHTVGEHLPGLCKALSSISGSIKNEQKSS